MTRRRAEFSKDTQRQAYERSQGRCESALVPSIEDIGCKRELRTGDINYDHISAEAISHDNSLDNCAVLCKACHKIKTTQHDVPAIAQDRRVSDLHRGITDPHRRRLAGGRDSEFKIRLADRKVVRRDPEYVVEVVE
jgi:hypothetical protein